ncbi:MAG: tetratricopeptide repeat protein [Planctomycetota bacterium]
MLLASCVSVSFETRADRAYRAGDLEEAARVYEQVLDRSAGGNREAHALYRLALIHSRPDSLLRDDAKAADLLHRVLQNHPDSRYAPQATLILDLQRQTTRLREMSNDLAKHIRELRDEANQAVTALQEEMGRVQGEAAVKQQRIAQLERQLTGLRNQLSIFNEEVEQLEEELRRLKEIDLALPP